MVYKVMDIKDFVNYIVFLPERAWEAFYKEKTSMLLDWQKKSSLAKMDVKTENLIDTIKKFFPEATIYSKGSRDYIKIKNVDFVIREPKTIGTKGSYGFYIGYIPNLVEYMKEVDRLMPEWEKEFAELLEQYEDEIKELERKSFIEGCSIANILENRIKLKLLNCRENTDATQLQGNALSEANLSLKNISVRPYVIKLNAINDYWVWHRYEEIEVWRLEQIDKMIPIWIEECKQWEYEYEKQKKAQEIKSMSVSALIKQKMKQLGCEYYISTNQKTTSLYIRLEKSRMLKLSLPDLAISTISRRIEMIEDAVKAINNIHNAFRITNEEKSIEWENGNDTK